MSTHLQEAFSVVEFKYVLVMSSYSINMILGEWDFI